MTQFVMSKPFHDQLTQPWSPDERLSTTAYPGPETGIATLYKPISLILNEWFDLFSNSEEPGVGTSAGAFEVGLEFFGDCVCNTSRSPPDCTPFEELLAAVMKAVADCTLTTSTCTLQTTGCGCMGKLLRFVIAFLQSDPVALPAIDWEVYIRRMLKPIINGIDQTYASVGREGLPTAALVQQLTLAPDAVVAAPPSSNESITVTMQPKFPSSLGAYPTPATPMRDTWPFQHENACGIAGWKPSCLSENVSLFPVAHVAPAFDTVTSGWQSMVTDFKGDVLVHGTDLYGLRFTNDAAGEQHTLTSLAPQPTVLQVTAGSSAAAGAISSPMLIKAALLNIGLKNFWPSLCQTVTGAILNLMPDAPWKQQLNATFTGLCSLVPLLVSNDRLIDSFVDVCLANETDTLGVPIGTADSVPWEAPDVPSYRTIDGAYTENSAVASTLAAMTKDCANGGGKLDCSKPLKFVALAGNSTASQMTLQEAETQSDGQLFSASMDEDDEVGTLVDGLGMGMGGWKVPSLRILKGEPKTGMRNSSRADVNYTWGEFTTISNPAWGVLPGYNVSLLLLYVKYHNISDFASMIEPILGSDPPIIWLANNAMLGFGVDNHYGPSTAALANVTQGILEDWLNEKLG